MKAILFTDIHLGLSKDSEEFHKITLDFADWMAEEATNRGIKNLICGGDVFHNRKSTSLATTDAAYRFFDKLRDFNIRIITGNHDCLYLDNSTIHSIELLKEWDNINIYDEPYYENFDGHVAGFIPWGTELKDIQKCDVMFGHFEIVGFQMGPAAFCKHGLNTKPLLDKCPLIFSGHFHKPQTNTYSNGKIVYMGSPFQHNWGEKGQDKYIYELDFKTLDYVPIENTVSPKHVEISDKNDIGLATGNIARFFVGSDDVDFLKKIEEESPVISDVVVEDKVIKKATETIKDFKGVDIMEGFGEVVEVIEGLNKDFKAKILAKCKDYHEQAKT